MFPLVVFSGFITFTLCVPRQYIFVNESKTWAEAQSYCRDKYTDLATIANEQETIQLLDTVNDYNSIDLAWIGLYDDLNVWKWTLENSDFFKDGENQFRNWNSPGPAHYGGRCVGFMYSGIWYPASCDGMFPCVCYDGRENANATYVFYPLYQSWKDAQTYCREHYTDLASVRNEAENQMIRDILQIQNTHTAWVGLYGTRSWSDQSNSTFTFWSTEEPDAGKHCTAVALSDSGNWTNENCDYEFPFFCHSELDSLRQYHFVFESKSWSDAQRYCRESYIDLATIDNMDEMNSLMNTVNDTYNGLAWIGLYHDLNSWRWSLEDDYFYQEGEREYRNWYHQPDNIWGNELCVYMDYYGSWHDMSCENFIEFVCYDGRESATERYIRINDRKTWTEARRYCREHHTDLVNVRNMSENQMILQSTGGEIWIGLYRNRIWSDNQISSYQNWRPEIFDSQKQPDNGNGIIGLWGYEHCIAVSFRYLGKWTDENCSSNIPFICYSRTCTQSSCSPRQYHFINESKSWSDAQRYCRENYIDLATVDNMDEMNSLIKTRRGIYYGKAWIGLYDDMKSWRWSLGNTELEGGYKNWNVEFPRHVFGETVCAYMSYYRGWWSDLFCQVQLPFVCYDGRQNASERYVLVSESKNWTEAQRYCREHHTDLVSIKNDIENFRVLSIIQYYNVVWIGLYRIRSWSDQSNSIFSNWRTGEPDGVGYCTVVSFSDNGTWTDENCEDLLPFICYSGEESFRQYHFVFEYKSWSDAQRYCREIYTDLATIDNMDEMNSLMNTVNDTYSGSAWIGLYDDLNSWKWSLEDNDFYQEGERDFRNWFHEPNNYNGDELCVYMGGADGIWADLSCDSYQPFVCYDDRENAQKYVLILEGRTWSDAQRYCREFHTDLASVRSYTESQEIQNILNGVYVWIGLYRNRLWSDQSNSTFTHWQPLTSFVYSQPDNGFALMQMGAQQCTAVSLQYFGQWTDESCLNRLPFFCYANEYVVGLRLLITSEENLSKSQIEERVIIQFQKKLIELGLPRNITMQLRNYRKTTP